MAYVGNTPTTQAFTSAIDYFSGNGLTTAFTLSRPVASVAQVQVTVNNVPQNPSTAFSVSGQTLTFTGTPSSGTNNIYVQYTSPITQVITPSQGTVGTSQLVDLSTTTAKIADNAITTAKIAAGAVIQADLAANVAGNGPAFYGYNNTNQASPSVGVWTKCDLNSELFDTNNNFASSRFTPTVAGYYQINGIVNYNVLQNSLCSAAIYKNGAIHQQGMTQSATATYIVTVNTLVYLNGSTDYVELYVYLSTTSAIAGGATNTTLSGSLVRAA